MAVILTIAELEAASATLDKLSEIAADDTARAILMQAQLLMLALGIRLVCAVEEGNEQDSTRIRCN